MDAERWKKIEHVFHAALQVEPSRRAAILEDSCAGDESLRHEVESLLAHHESAETFIETPAFATAKATAGSEQLTSGRIGVPVTVGAAIAQYRVLEEIGAGGMGVVYKAEDTKLGRLVALKFLPATLATDASALERFQREARAASALNHPNICTIYAIEEYQGHAFIAMEYLDGMTLKDYILKHPLDIDDISKLAIQIAEALSAAHSRGVVHRDVKPGNIIVSASGPVKVLDFGLAKLVDSQAGNVCTRSLTESHTVTGTLPYMSPEQLRGREVDSRTDIYALGVVLYEMATGRRPFAAEIAPQLIDDILNSPPGLPRQVNPKISPKLEEIILKCLEKDPDDRYQSAKEIAVDLRRMMAPSSASQRLAAAQPKFGKSARLLWIAIPVLALAILAVGWILLRTSVFNPIRSIAVLPFVDDAKDASSQYVVDGITEGVIDKLSEVQSLRVMSRTSVFRFKGKESDALTAGKTLNVQMLLTGRIARQADVLLLRAELIDVSDGARLWGRQFRYSMSDRSRVQDDLAAAVSDKLQLRLNSTEESRLTRHATDNAEAYQLYLQARYYLNQRTGFGIRKSIESFQQATEKDPNFALAYAGLADAFNLSNILGIQSPRESSPEAKAAAVKALVLDPRLGEAHAALGLVESHYDHDFPSAQRNFLKAIELNPNYSNAYLFYAGAYLTPMGRHQDAIAEMKKALELDPLSLPLNSLMGNTYLWAGDFEKSAQQFRHTIDLEPTFPMAHFFYANVLAATGKYKQAIEEVKKGQLVAGARPEDASTQAARFQTAFQTDGPKGYWQKNLELTLSEYQQSAGRYSPALDVASAYATVGDKEKALEWLDKSYAERDGNITLINSYPEFKNLHGDPRFARLLHLIGLPD